MTPADGFDLRVCTGAHGAVLAALQESCFDEAWGDEAIATLLSRPGVFGLLACRLDEPVEGELEPLGFVLCRVAADESEILSIGVMPEARRRGIATELMEAAMLTASEHGAARMFLEVAVSNDRARALYASLGFDERGRRTDYYDGAVGTVDAVILGRDL